MGLLEDALKYQDAKRSQRFSREARKAKIEANKIKEGTYRGIDLVDGTAIVQLDGQPNATSGYRLITNAPLGDGDRVSIRPNGVGLPRADARNVAPPLVEDVAIVEDIFREATIPFVDFFCFSGSSFSSFQQSSFRILSQSSLIYKYKNTKLIDIPSNATATGSGQNVTRNSNQDATTIPIIVTANIESTSENLVVTASLDTPFIEVPFVSSGGGGNLPPTAFLLQYIISLPINQWKDILKKYDDYQDWINPSIESFYLWTDCPIEIDARGGVTVTDDSPKFGLTDSLILISSDATEDLEATTIFINVDGIRNPETPFIQPFPTGTEFQFSIRYRRRGATRWFQL